jgi:hypothetical protein
MDPVTDKEQQPVDGNELVTPLEADINELLTHIPPKEPRTIKEPDKE